MTEVFIQSLIKRYDNTTAINDLTLKVGHGEFISLLGPSGCGKTTTLKCIAGFEACDGGQIMFDGRDVSRLLPEHRDIGMVFQSYALFPHMTVAQNLGFGLEMRKVPRQEIASRVAAVLDLVQLANFGPRYPRALSGGQQQRVALARALVIEPKILLLDEPLANLDAALRDEMRAFIRDIQRRVGITTLYVTHDQAEAMTMSDRVVVMFTGSISQVDVPDVIYDRPANEAVARFVGQANFFEAAIFSDLLPTDASGWIMARPEAITMEAPVSGRPGLIGRIVARTFHGAFIDYRVDMSGQSIMVHSPTSSRWREGDDVALIFDPARLWPVGAPA